MKIRNIVHKSLKKLYLLRTAQKGCLRIQWASSAQCRPTLQDMQDPENLRAFPLWKAHQLTGDRKGVWSLHVTRNRRLTFQIKDGEILEVDDEDYH